MKAVKKNVHVICTFFQLLAQRLIAQRGIFGCKVRFHQNGRAEFRDYHDRIRRIILSILVCLNALLAPNPSPAHTFSKFLDSKVKVGYDRTPASLNIRNNVLNWLYLGFAIFCEVLGTSALNLSDGFNKPVPTALSLFAFAISFFLLSLALKTIPVGVAYAIWSGTGIVLISAIGYFIFKQSLDGPALLGIGLILAGVIIINRFSNSVGH